MTKDASMQRGMTIPLASIEEDIKAMVARRWGIEPATILSLKVSGDQLYLALTTEVMKEREKA